MEGERVVTCRELRWLIETNLAGTKSDIDRCIQLKDKNSCEIALKTIKTLVDYLENWTKNCVER